MKKKLSAELYQKAPINDLILFCLSENCSFETLVQRCFRFFPKVFCFSTISKWPDSRKLDRPLRSLRKEKLIKGNPQDGFSLTSKGKKRVKEVEKIFNQQSLEI